jgi:hypothetical protein
VNVDPLASLKCWAIEVTVGGRDWTIPAAPAAAWWPILADLDPMSVIDMIDDPGLSDHLLDAEVDPGEIGEVMIEAIEAAAGRSFMAASIIAGIVNSHWASINGQLIRDGVRWEELPLGAVLDAAHALLLERFGEQKNEKTQRLYRDEYLAALETPLPGTEGSDAAREQALADFEALAGPRPTGRVAPQTLSTGAPSGDTPPRTRTPSRPPRRPARSAAPIEPPATPVRSDPAARSAPPRDAVAPASGRALRPRPRSGRSPLPPRSAAPGSEQASPQ